MPSNRGSNGGNRLGSVPRKEPNGHLALVPPADSDAIATRFLSVKQLASYLQINEKKVYLLAGEGTLPGTKITGKWLFPRELVDQWLLEASHGGVLTDRLVVTGSDDPLLQRVVVNLTAEVQGHALVNFTPTGSQLGLKLLASGRADVAAIHWGPVEESHLRHPALLQEFVQHAQWVLVRAFVREQGLLIAPRVDYSPQDFGELFARNLRWAFRQQGSGSQRFLQETAIRHGVDLSRLAVTHVAKSEREAASLLAMGDADIAPGVHGAATEFGLEFIPTGREAFDLALPRRVYFRTLFQRLLEELRGEQTRALAESLNGYDLTPCGRIIWGT